MILISFRKTQNGKCAEFSLTDTVSNSYRTDFAQLDPAASGSIEPGPREALTPRDFWEELWSFVRGSLCTAMVCDDISTLKYLRDKYAALSGKRPRDVWPFNKYNHAPEVGEYLKK